MLGTVSLFQFTANLHSAVLTFDEVATAEITPVPIGYGGLQWNNFGIENGAISADYLSGVVSSPNVAFNLYGDPASFSSVSAFTLGSGHFKAVLQDGMQLVVRGLLAGTTIYSNAYVLSSATPTFLQFNYSNVNEVKFTTSPDSWFTMDNLAVTGTATNANCMFTLSSTYSYYLKGAETGSVAVATQWGCGWTVSNTNSWLTITSGLNYTNTGSVSYTLTANTNGLARSGFIEIVGQAFAITQYGESGTNWEDVVLTFDDLFTGDYTIINGYGGLDWSNFFKLNGLSTGDFVNGIASPPYVAFLGGAGPASFSRSTPINLKSAYLTSKYANGLEVRVQGFRGPNPAYDNTYVLSGNSPILINFYYLSVDHVVISHSPGGLAMDNLTFAVSDTNEPCAFSTSPSHRQYGHDLATGDVSVFTQSGCSWSASTSNDWVTITSSLTNTGSGSVTFTVATNATGVPRSGFINLAGQAFGVSQYGAPGTNVVDVGQIQTATIGHSCITNAYPPYVWVSVSDYLVDQDQSSGGGGVHSSFSANFDTANQFVLKISAAPGKKFRVRPPSGQAVHFGGYFYWRGSPYWDYTSVGTVAVSFGGLEGTPPDFSASSSFLADFHGWFGFNEIHSTDFSNDFTFSAMTLAATVPAANVGAGILDYNLDFDSQLFLTYDPPLKMVPPKDPGPFVSIVSIPQPVLTLARQPNGNVTITFTGILQSASGGNGTFEDVPGYPKGTYTIPKENLTTHQYFRARGD